MQTIKLPTMKQFIYTHHQGGEGKMVEKATILEPSIISYTSHPMFSKLREDFYQEPPPSFERLVAYYNDSYKSKLLTYPTLGFSPSDNGKTFGEDEFRLKFEGCTMDLQCECFADYENSMCLNKLLIAVPLSEKREEIFNDKLISKTVKDLPEKYTWEDVFQIGKGIPTGTQIMFTKYFNVPSLKLSNEEKREVLGAVVKHGKVTSFEPSTERMFTLEEMKDAWDAALQSMELHQSLKTSKQQYFQTKFSITLK